MDFSKHVEWLCRLCRPKAFKAEMNEFISYHSNSTSRVIDSELGIIKGEERIIETGEPEEYTLRFDEHILNNSEAYLNEPINNIIKPIKADTRKEMLGQWILELNIAISLTNDDDYYDNFPKYIKALNNTVKLLKELRSAIQNNSLKVKRANKKRLTEKAYELEKYLKLINKAGSHEDAIKKLSEEVSGFQWNYPNKELFYKKEEELNKTNVSLALEEVGKILWDKSPKSETIRSTLLKP